MAFVSPMEKLVGFEHEILFWKLFFFCATNKLPSQPRQDAAAKLLQSVQVGVISHGQMRSRFECVCWKGMEWHVLCIEWSGTYKNDICILYITYSIQLSTNKRHQGKKVAYVPACWSRYSCRSVMDLSLVARRKSWAHPHLGTWERSNAPEAGHYTTQVL